MRAGIFCGLALGAAVLSAPDAWAQTQKQAPKSATTKKQPVKKPQQGLNAPALKPLAPAQLFARGFEYFQNRQFEDAEALFQEGLKRDDKDHRAWEVLTRIYIAQHKHEQAVQSLLEAVDRGLPDANALALEKQLDLRVPVHTQRLFGKPSGVHSLSVLGVRAAAGDLRERECDNPYGPGPKQSHGSESYLDGLSVECYFGEWMLK